MKISCCHAVKQESFEKEEISRPVRVSYNSSYGSLYQSTLVASEEKQQQQQQQFLIFFHFFFHPVQLL